MTVIQAPDVAVQEAAVGRLRDELARVEESAARSVAAVRERLSEAEAALHAERREVIGEAVQAWRRRAAELREQAEQAGDATTVVPIHVYRPGVADYVEPQIRYRRFELIEEAEQATAKAQLFENWLRFDQADIELRFAELEFPPS